MKKLQGFAAISKEQRTEIARKGGLSVSLNLEHMKEIGRRGGLNSQAKARALRAKKSNENVQEDNTTF